MDGNCNFITEILMLVATLVTETSNGWPDSIIVPNPNSEKTNDRDDICLSVCFRHD